MNLREFFTTNTWWGKCLGAFFGYLIAGSIGACFGIIIGNFFDRSFSSYYANPNWFYFSEQRKAIQKIFFEATFLVMGHIAKTDGRVSEQEINMAKMMMSEMRLDKEQTTQAKRLFNEGKSPHFNLNKCINHLHERIHDGPELLKLFVDIQYRAAQVDGLTTQKIQALDTVFTLLGFAPLHQQYRFHEDFDAATNDQQRYRSSSSSHQEQHSSRAINHLDHAYAMLEVNPQASKQEIKRSYRRLLNRNHPDKLIAKGMPPEMIKIANEKTQKIVKAYALICKTQGW